MRPAYVLLLVLIWLASRCSHTHAVSDEQSPASPAQTDEGARQSAGKRESPAGHGKAADPSARGDRDRPALPTSPAGLLRPGGIAAVQDKLIARGYLEEDARSQKLDRKTEKALRSFQHDQGLPATGAPNDSTVEKLGIKPNDIFRASSTASGKP